MPSRIPAAALFFATFAMAGPSGADDAPGRAENVIVVVFDGFRHQEFFGGADPSLMDAKAGGVRDLAALKARFWRDSAEGRREALLPFLWTTVAKRGQIFGDRSRAAPATLTNGMKFSYPGYSEMFCGFGDPRIDSNDKKPNPNRSVLEFLDERPGFRGKVGAICTWDVFPSIFRSDRNKLFVHSGWTPIADEPLSPRQEQANRMVEHLPRYWRDNCFDVVAMEFAAEHLRKNKPRVLFVGLGETDEWAHGRRYDLYLESAASGDRFLAETWATIQAMPEYRDRTALIVTTDHGRGSTTTNWTDHGQKVEGAEGIWIGVMGPATPALGVREGVESTQSQVAATIAALLGEDFLADSPKSAPPLAGVLPAVGRAK